MEPKKRSPPAAWVAKHGYPPDDDQPIELYDLKNDIGETKDVAAANPRIVKQLELFVERMRAELGDALTGRKGSGGREPGRAAVAP